MAISTSLLSMEQMSNLALLKAMIDPNARDLLGNMINQIIEAQQKAETAISQMEAQEGKNRAILNEARVKFAAAEEMKAEVVAREMELAAKEGRTREVLDALNAEKAAFEDVRTRVTEEQTTRRDSLATREVALAEREDRIGKMMAQYSSRLAALDEREGKLHTTIAALTTAMAALE